MIIIEKPFWPFPCGRISPSSPRTTSLCARAIDEDGDGMTFRLYPIGEDEFGRKGGMLKLTFGDGCVMFDDYTCNKL